MYPPLLGAWGRKLALAFGIIVVVSLLPVTPAQAAKKSYQSPIAQKEPLVAGSSYRPKAVMPGTTGRAFTGGNPQWPAASTVDVAVPSQRLRELGATGRIFAQGLPVAVDPDAATPDKVRVQAFDRKAAQAAGIDGILLRVSRSDGQTARAPINLTIDYRGFRYAYGGDWASRLKVRVLPECVLTKPFAADCRGTELPTRNDTSSGTASARISVDGFGTRDHDETMTATATGGTLVALAAATSGGGGDYAATSLSPSATWNAGGNAGDFSWSYPLRVPPSLGGPSPSISLDYSSSSVDGRMASTNNQPSWLGEGFDWQPGAIERRYNACNDDMNNGGNNTAKVGDQCWETDNASLTLAGHAGELLKDAGNGNLWHLRNDDGTIVEHKTGASNGDNDGEWWVATTPDGTQYWFGGRSGSNAALTEPVFGNNAGEPCHATAFKDSSCTQAYRWQLDYVVDLHGNTMTYSYAKETNRYGRNNDKTDAVQYDRAGYLTSIQYGTNTAVPGTAPMQVIFTVADRCLSGCTTKDAAHWPDVPWDQECAASPCKDTQLSPSMWTTKRLAEVKTQVSGVDVEQWTFTHSFPDPTDSITAALWLDKISHKGLVGTTTTLPDVSFVGVYLPNRVDTNNDQYPAMNKFRIKTITSESGGKLDVSYSAPDCVKGTRMPDQAHLESNVYRCYPVKWIPGGQTSPINDFFHKYLVTDVVEADLTGSSVRVVTHYDYLGDPAWHYTDDDGFIKKDYKTWSVWRGYATVRTIKGDPGEQTMEERRYFRGMNGDHLPTGTRSVVLPAISVGNVPAVNDEDAFSGMARETITYNGPGGAEVSADVSEPWQSAATATRTINGTTVYARYAGTAVKHDRTTLDGGRAARTTSQATTFDAYGMPVVVEDRGDEAVNGDETCTLTDYVRNTGIRLLTTVARTRKFSTTCARAQAGTGLGDDDVLSDSKTSYDNLAWNTAPTKGDVTTTESLLAFNSGSPTYLTDSRSTYDVYGRVLDAYDIRGNKTTTAYTPATGGAVTLKTETSPLGWVKTTNLEPAYGLTTSTTDANGRKIEMTYDGLGRLTQVWFAGRDKATQTPNIVYDYLIRNNASTVLVTKRLNAAGNYIVTYKHYDNLLRERQTQESDGAGGVGAVVTDTYYDSAGRAFKTHEHYMAADASHQPVAPSTSLFLPSDTIPSQTLTLYDGAGREIADITQVNAPPASPGGTEKWRSSTSYGGDRTDVVPPAGGVSTSTILDARGNVVELRQFHAGAAPGLNPPPSTYDATTYTYDAKDQLRKVTDAAGNHWDYTFDVRGRQTDVTDPDKGHSHNTFNDVGDLVSTTDANNVTVAYTYDTIGRKTTMRDGSVTGPKRSEWFYDTLTNGTSVKGQLVKTIRYDGTDQYIKEHIGYTVDYKPTSVKYTIPTGLTGVGGTYSYVYSYNQDGSPATTRLPTVGDLGLETLTFGYNALGKATTLSTTLGATYVTGTDYTSYNEIGVIHLRNNSGSIADITRTYETDTRRLAQIWTTRATAPTTVSDVRYSYNNAGDVTKEQDLTSGDTQCFTEDYLRRLTEAWTPSAGDCSVAPSTAGLGGPAPYWQTYSYDALGSRSQLVEHQTPNGVRTTTYTVPAGAHRLTGTSSVDGSGTKTGSYTYDSVGNTKTRPTPAAGTQTLTWDPEGHLASSQDSSGTTSFIYDVDGNRLVRKDPTGVTLYLPNQELRYTSSTAAKTGTRYYTHAESIVATRTSAGVTWLSGDQHGTADIAITAVGQATAIRRETPFGESRTGSGSWPASMDKGFVGGTKDNTGLTHLGAREYDPAIGRFVSVDPIVDSKDSQQLHGYAYSNNSPLSCSDPDGQVWGWLKSAAKAVTTGVTNFVKDPVGTATEAGRWVYNHAGTLSTGLALAATICSFIPPLQVAAPFLGAASAVLGALDTYKSCSEGAALDCGMGIAGMIPGGRALGAFAKGAKGVFKAGKRMEEASSAIAKYHDDIEEGLRIGNRAEKRGLVGELKDARREFAGRWNPDRFEDHHRGFGIADKFFLGENTLNEACKAWFGCADSRQKNAGLNPWWSRNWGGHFAMIYVRPSNPIAAPTASTSSYYQNRQARWEKYL